MKRIRIALMMACCTTMLNGCLYQQKRMVDLAGPTVQAENGGGVSQQTGNGGGPGLNQQQGLPIRESDLMSTGGQSAGGGAGGSSFLPSVAYVTGRISEYNQKVERWRQKDGQAAVLRIPADESEKMVNCYRELQKVLNGYNRLHGYLLQHGATPSSDGGLKPREVYELQQSDIAFVDGECGQMVASGSQSGGSVFRATGASGLASVEAMIAQHAASGEYEELLQVWRQIPESETERVQWRTKLLYGNALMALQQEGEAAKIYRQMVDQAVPADGMASDLLSMRKILADLYIASGDFRAAEAEYLQISKEYKEMARVEEWAILQRSILEKSDPAGPELKDYAEMLKNYLGYNPAKDGYTVVWQADKFLQSYPYSPVASNVDMMRMSARERADKWSKNVMTEADVLADQKRYQDALGKLETVPSGIVSSETQAQLAKKVDDVALAEKLAKETVKLEQAQDLERLWGDAVRLMDKGNYDQAIAAFTPLLSSEYADKAGKKIAEASLLAAEAERRDAAELFIRFTKSTDLESKKKLLVESRRRLMDILVKYPGVEITDKVNGNIQRVEKEMNALDPNLVKDSGRLGNDTPQGGGASGSASAAGVSSGVIPVGNATGR